MTQSAKYFQHKDGDLSSNIKLTENSVGKSKHTVISEPERQRNKDFYSLLAS